jgi:co-chaperonin GroES (HSP10)
MLQPLGKRLLVKAYKETSKKSVLILEDPEPWKYQVIEVGDEVKKLIKDDFVVIGSYGSMPITYKEEKYLIVEEAHVLAKVT